MVEEPIESSCNLFLSKIILALPTTQVLAVIKLQLGCYPSGTMARDSRLFATADRPVAAIVVDVPGDRAAMNPLASARETSSSYVGEDNPSLKRRSTPFAKHLSGTSPRFLRHRVPPTLPSHAVPTLLARFHKCVQHPAISPREFSVKIAERGVGWAPLVAEASIVG